MSILGNFSFSCYIMFSLIAAMASNHVIGKDNELPWNYPEDLKYFMTITKGKTIVLGRKSHDSVVAFMWEKWPLLPARHSIILTRSEMPVPVSQRENTTAEIADSIQDIVARYEHSDEEVMIVWGAEIYKLFLPYTQKIYLTEIHKSYDWDAFFPVFESDFTEISRDKRGEFDFVVYERK